MMLTFRNARAVLETALVDHLRLGLARRLPPVDSLVELAAATPHAVPDGALRFVREQQCCFAWQPSNIKNTDSFISDRIAMAHGRAFPTEMRC